MEKTSMNENSQHIGANVLPLCAGGDFETQIDHGNSKPDRTTRRIVTVKPRLRQTAVTGSSCYLKETKSPIKNPLADASGLSL